MNKKFMDNKTQYHKDIVSKIYRFNAVSFNGPTDFSWNFTNLW